MLQMNLLKSKVIVTTTGTQLLISAVPLFPGLRADENT